MGSGVGQGGCVAGYAVPRWVQLPRQRDSGRPAAGRRETEEAARELLGDGVHVCIRPADWVRAPLPWPRGGVDDREPTSRHAAQSA